MKHFIREHEQTVEQALLQDHPARGLRVVHQRQIGYLQHERLIHLLVTLCFALLTLGTLVLFVLRPEPLSAVLLVLLLALLVPYIWHYFLLENATQRWYRLARRLDRKLGRYPADSTPGRWG